MRDERAGGTGRSERDDRKVLVVVALVPVVAIGLGLLFLEWLILSGHR